MGHPHLPVQVSAREAASLPARCDEFWKRPQTSSPHWGWAPRSGWTCCAGARGIYPWYIHDNVLNCIIRSKEAIDRGVYHGIPNFPTPLNYIYIYIHMFGRLKLVKAPLLSPLLLVFVPIPWRPAQDTVDGKAARSSYKKLALKARLKTVNRFTYVDVLFVHYPLVNIQTTMENHHSINVKLPKDNMPSILCFMMLYVSLCTLYIYAYRMSLVSMTPQFGGFFW